MSYRAKPSIRVRGQLVARQEVRVLRFISVRPDETRLCECKVDPSVKTDVIRV